MKKRVEEFIEKESFLVEGMKKQHNKEQRKEIASSLEQAVEVLDTAREELDKILENSTNKEVMGTFLNDTEFLLDLYLEKEETETIIEVLKII